MVGENDQGSISSSFWDIETSGKYTSDGGIGKTTLEMQTESTFTDAGWDFAGETINGPNDIWDICEAMNYPKLVWSIPQADLACPDGVNFIDYAYFTSLWNTTDPNADFDMSGAVDANDLNILSSYWLTGF